MNVICPICNQEFSDNKHPYSNHKIKLADFFPKYFPKLDKLTNEPIPFKSIEQYLTTDFVNKRNLASWVKKQPVEVAKDYCKELLIKRKNKKGLIYSMSQVELRTLPMPSVLTYNELFGDYYKLCEEIGLKNKYKSVDKLEFKPCEYNVQIDSREQSPFIFKYLKSEVKKLNFGDYLLQSSDNYVYFERKSLSDAIGSLSTGYERFCRELDRAQEAKEHLIIIVEESLNNLLSFNYLPHISKKIKVTPDFITRNIRDIIQKYPLVQFLFANGRVKAVEVMEKILFMGEIYKEIDLGLVYDSKLL